MYGSKVFIRIPETRRKSKWDKKAETGILLGYTDTGYRVLINNKIVVARHCDIIEEDVTLCGFQDERDEEGKETINDFDGIIDIEKENVTNTKLKQKNNTDHLEENKTNNANSGDEIKEDENKNEKKLRRQIKTPLRFDEEFGYYCISVNYCDATTPEDYQEAIACKDSNKWKAAMDSEMDSLVKNKTWTLVDKPLENKKVIDVKWIYKRKNEDEYKARLVVKGFQQTDRVDDTYSPVAKMQTLKILLSYCCQNSLKIHQMDVETAFLNGKVLSEVYVKQPMGYEEGTEKVYLLNKSLYGLKESPRAWYECFNGFLNTLDFQSANMIIVYIIKRRMI